MAHGSYGSREAQQRGTAVYGSMQGEGSSRFSKFIPPSMRAAGGRFVALGQSGLVSGRDIAGPEHAVVDLVLASR